jgi:hypothetical protein
MMVSFTYPNKAEVTVIISKTGGRYRIQSSQYEALMFITNQIILRLNEYYKYEITFYIEDDLNVSEYFNIIENHFKLYTAKKSLNNELVQHTTLYTTVQKNLLNKYKVIVKNIFKFKFRKKTLLY